MNLAILLLKDGSIYPMPVKTNFINDVVYEIGIESDMGEDINEVIALVKDGGDFDQFTTKKVRLA